MGEPSDEIIALLKMARPPCPICNWPLWPINLETVRADRERSSFLCPRCEYEMRARHYCGAP